MPEKLFFSTDHLKLIVETTANNGSTISSRPKTDATQDVRQLFERFRWLFFILSCFTRAHFPSDPNANHWRHTLPWRPAVSWLFRPFIPVFLSFFGSALLVFLHLTASVIEAPNVENPPPKNSTCWSEPFSEITVGCTWKGAETSCRRAEAQPVASN